MSLHSSLRSGTGKVEGYRNVLKRHERLQDLVTRGLWTEGQSVFGLPKTRRIRVKTRKTAAPKAAAATPGQPTTAPASGAAPENAQGQPSTR